MTSTSIFRQNSHDMNIKKRHPAQKVFEDMASVGARVGVGVGVGVGEGVGVGVGVGEGVGVVGVGGE